MQSIPDILYVLDTESSIIKWNRKAEDASGYSTDELSRKLIFELIAERAQTVAITAINDAYVKGHAEFNAPLIRKDGVEIPYRWTTAVLTDGNGNEPGLIGIGHDLTDQMHAAEMERMHLIQQRAIMDNIPDLVWVKDTNGVYLAVNTAFQTFIGKSENDILGKTDLDLFPEEYARKFQTDDKEVMSSCLQKRMEEPAVDASGIVRKYETIKAPMYDDSRRLLGTIGIARESAQK